jgi:DNA-binding transcriptional ArsR family regulator
MSIHATEPIVHPAQAELELGAVLHALSDPVRLRIVAELARREGEYTCGSFALPVTKSTCTHHFKVLREAGLIHQRPQGTTRLNRLRREDLEVRFPGLLETILQAAAAATPGVVPAGTATPGVVPAASAAAAAELKLKAPPARAVA